MVVGSTMETRSAATVRSGKFDVKSAATARVSGRNGYARRRRDALNSAPHQRHQSAWSRVA